MPINLLEALMGMHVDTSGLESGLKKAEQLAEQATKSIAGSFSLMSVGITTALVGGVIVALEKCIKTTADFGLEMEHLGDRMGMTAKEASTLTGVMERYGVGAGVAARSMQIMAMEMKQTGDSIDPLNTKLGRVLGTLRDSNGNLLNMSQVLDLARQKISAAGSATEQLQLAQQIFGSRMGGQLLPMLKLSNDEWEKQKKSVEDSLGPVDEAATQSVEYEKATADLDQAIKGLEISIGTKLLPTLTSFVSGMSKAVGWVKDFASDVRSSTFDLNEFGKQLEHGIAPASSIQKKAFNLGDLTPDQLEKYAKAAKLLNTELAAGSKLGITDAEQRKAALETELAAIRQQVANEQDALSGKHGGLDPQQILDSEAKIAQLKVQEAQVVSKAAEEQYSEEEMHIKANGLLNQSTEIDLLQKKLADERIVGDERLKIEADLYQKRKKYEEDAVQLGVKMGAVSVDQEIAYRKSKAAQLLGAGDVLGAGAEVMKAKDLAIQQAEEEMNTIKKIRVVSLQDEIDFQKQKLEAVKGNASEEMKVIQSIADLDKKLYDERLQFGLNYTQNIVGQYNKIMDAAKKSGETQSFEQARIDSERKLVESTREARQVLQGGGTEAQRGASVDFAQFVYKQVEQMQSMGKEVSGIWKDAADTAKDILKAASGGEEVRAPGGPSPTIGSLMSPVEGLATQGLARGTDIPRLDTSFTDLATRVRDVLLGTIPNVQNLSNAFQDAAKKIAGITGFQLNPGIVGPGGGITTGPSGSLPSNALPTGSSTPAPPTVGPGGTPTQPSVEIGVGSVSSSDNASQLKALIDAINSGNKDLIDALNTQGAANQEQLVAAVQRIQDQNRTTGTNVSVTLDPGTGDLIVSRIEKELAP